MGSVRRRAGISASFGLLMLAACGGTETGAQLSTNETDEGVVLEARWTYRSFEVDVDLRLQTTLNGEECSTTARLVVNDVVSASETHRLPPTDCAILRLTEIGDIVFYEQETGHAWSEEELSLNTSREVISLGPVTLRDPESGEDVRYAFTLAAPPCPDDDECRCGVLARHANEERLELPLGRKCD